MTSSSNKLGPFPVFFWLFWQSRNAFGPEFLWQKYFANKIKVILTAGFKIVVKSDINEHCQGVILQKQLVCFCKCISFKPFNAKTNLFSLKSAFEFIVHQGKPTINLALSPLMDQRLVSALMLVIEPELSLHLYFCC